MVLGVFVSIGSVCSLVMFLFARVLLLLLLKKGIQNLIIWEGVKEGTEGGG